MGYLTDKQKTKSKALIKELLKCYNIDTDTYPEMEDTPRRVSEAYEELFEYILTNGRIPFRVTFITTKSEWRRCSYDNHRDCMQELR